MAAITTGRPYDVADTAAQHHVETDDLAPLVGWAGNLWRERLAPLFPSPIVETQIALGASDDAVRLTGTPDLMSIADDELRIVDWKSGWADQDATEQLRGYAWLGLNATVGIEQARVTKLQIRHGRAETLVWTRAELLRWWDWLKAHLIDAETFRPGIHCGRCPRALECPAHANQIANLSTMLLGSDGRHVDATEPYELANTVKLARLVARRAEEFQDAVKARVEAHGGRLGPMALNAQDRRSIDVSRGWSELQSIGDDLYSMLKISKGDVETAVKATAPRGQKGTAVKSFLDRLDAAGALNTSTIYRLEIDNGSSNEGTRSIPAGAEATSGSAAG